MREVATSGRMLALIQGGLSRGITAKVMVKSQGVVLCGNRGAGMVGVEDVAPVESVVVRREKITGAVSLSPITGRVVSSEVTEGKHPVSTRYAAIAGGRLTTVVFAALTALENSRLAPAFIVIVSLIILMAAVLVKVTATAAY